MMSRLNVLSLVVFVCCCVDVIQGTITVFRTFHDTFNNPYAGGQTGIGGALLDMNIETPCPFQLSINVSLPTTLAGQTNAVFTGTSFGPRLIHGVSQHQGFNGGNTFATALLISWDSSTSTLTFSGFDLFEAVHVFAPTNVGDGKPDWVNVNFNVAPTVFGPTDTGNNLPLNLTPLPPGQPPLQIQLEAPDYFLADTTSATCGGGVGDPVFSGFQGQSFQFHGLPDEHFNLISSPDVQLNSHFVYLSSGKCDFNDTECFTHPGTYMDVLGFSMADARVKLVAGTHEQGLRVWLNNQELHRGTHLRALSTNATASLRYHHNGHVVIHTENMNFEIVNSDMFMNIRVALNDRQLLSVGSAKHTVTDHAICRTNSETHNHQLVESTVAKKYPVNTPLHGLIGQTWRNVKVCGRDWMGTVQDYLASDLFASDYHYNYFKY